MKLAAEIKVDTSRLDAIRKACPERAEAIVEKAARNIERRAKDNAPVDTGALKGSIHVEPAGQFSRTIGDGVEYGIFQEYGSAYMGAQPWLIPAVEAERADFLKSWGDLLK